MTTKVECGDKVNVVLHPALYSQNSIIKLAILREASEQLGRKVTWDDIEDYSLTLKVELSLY